MIFPAAITILIVLAYAPAWRFPFIQDDIGLFNWIADQDLAGLWQTSAFGYYRPLAQVVWKIGELLAGRFEPVMLHWVNVAAHAINAWLVGYLASRWLPKPVSRPGQWLAGVLFALYPFTFQVIPFVGALYHPLVSMMILGALAAHAAYRATGSRAGLIAGCAGAALAPFAHEAGFAAGPLLIVSELVSAWTERHRPSWRILAWGAATAAFGLFIWLSVPKIGPQTARPDLNGVLINLSYAVQGLTYPIGPLAHALVDATGVSDQLVLWTMGAVFVAAAGWLAWRGGAFRLFAYATALWLIGALPFAVALVPRYALAATWLLYEQSIGAVLVWCATLAGFLRLPGDERPRRRHPLKGTGGTTLNGPIRAFVSWLFVISILAFSLWFIRTRMALYDRLSESLWSLGTAMQAHPDSRSALVVNFPRLARPSERVYPIGVESPQFYGRTSSLYAALTVNGLRVPEDVATLTFGNLIPPLDYSIETMGAAVDWPDLAAAIASVDRVYRSYAGPDRIPVRYAGRQIESTSITPLVAFDRSAALIDAEARLVETDVLAVTLRWQYLGGADDAVVFVHVLNASGELIAQADGPVMGMLPFWQWPDGDLVEEVRYIPLEPAGSARVSVGIYHPGTGDRLAPIDVRGAAYADGAAPLFEIDADAETIRPVIMR